MLLQHDCQMSTWLPWGGFLDGGQEIRAVDKKARILISAMGRN